MDVIASNAEMFAQALVDSPKQNALDLAVEQFKAEIVDMLEPDKSGNSIHHVHFPDHSWIDGVTVKGITGTVHAAPTDQQ